MQQDRSDKYLENRLILEISSVEKKIGELTVEKRTLERLLLKARAVKVQKAEAVRSTSATRIVIERLIMDLLHQQKEKQFRTHEILQFVRGTNFAFKESTLRSHLHRMKLKGLIVNPYNHAGRWVAAKPN